VLKVVSGAIGSVALNRSSESTIYRQQGSFQAEEGYRGWTITSCTRSKFCNVREGQCSWSVLSAMSRVSAKAVRAIDRPIYTCRHSFQLAFLYCCRYVHDWSKCPYAHKGEVAARRDPRKTLYWPEPCPDASKVSLSTAKCSCTTNGSVYVVRCELFAALRQMFTR
jgi:hypothetical protein